MDTRGFVTGLFETGTVLLEGRDVPADTAFETCRDLFVDLDEHTRLNLAFEPPAPILEVTRWACARLYCACLFLVHRDADAGEVREALSVPCPGGGEPAAVAYSADLLLRYLPDVHALAGGLSPEDPLVDALESLGRQWPLSSVGMKGRDDEIDLSIFVENRSLRQLYVDRILERGDGSRATDPVVQEWIRQSVGLARELCPGLEPLFEERTAP